MGFVLYEIHYGEETFESSDTTFTYIIQDIIEQELNMEWFDKVVVHKDDYRELLQNLEEWMQNPRSEEFFQNHIHLDREDVEDFIDFLNEVDCFCQEEC